jgi:transposase
MAQERLPMRKIKEVLRLTFERGLSQRQVAASCSVAQSTVIEYLRRARKAGLSWPLPEDLGEAALEGMLFHTAAASPTRPMPDFQHVHDELRRHRRVNLTLMQLWDEYRQKHTDGYEYTQFCEHYRRWRGKLDYVMRQEHRAGEKLFVDYGDGLYVTDPATGVLTMTQLFVGVWGFSNYCYAEASLSQALPCWIASHVRAFSYFGCAPYVLVPDNLKPGVSKACRYDPDINPTYAELAAHYGTAVMPARAGKPRDKAKVEAGVLVAKRWILAVLRNHVFFSLAEMNAAIRGLLERLNSRKLNKLQKSRRELFDSQDRPAAQTLPERVYQFAEWRKPRVNLNYHVEVEHHYYSVPCRLLREQLDVRLTATTFEAFHRGERMAAHVRSYVVGGYTTLREHMPSEHQKFAEWTPERILAWTGKAGTATTEVAGKILASKAFPEQGYKACLGLVHQGERYGADRLEAACRRALRYNTCTFRSIKSILARGLDRQAGPEQPQQETLPFHENVRGKEYYH